MHLLVFLVLITFVRAQYNSCLCSCCTDVACNPVPQLPLYLQQCTTEKCIQHCRATYPQCRPNTHQQLISVQCGFTPPAYICRCECCNTGSFSCSPSFVGYSLAFLCQASSCSISCANQYPSQCTHLSGQTQGTCSGYVTTTSTTTSTSPWLGTNSCSCMCCATGTSCSPTYVGMASAPYCSFGSCKQACQHAYPWVCPSSPSVGQVNGICGSVTSGNIFCKCKCCKLGQCIQYDINTSGNCATCKLVCREQSRCHISDEITHRCYISKAPIRSSCWILLFTIASFILVFY